MTRKLSCLSHRERLVLALTLFGMTSKQAASLLHMNSHSVEYLRRRAYQQLGVHSSKAAREALSGEHDALEELALPFLLYFHQREALLLRERMAQRSMRIELATATHERGG